MMKKKIFLNLIVCLILVLIPTLISAAEIDSISKIITISDSQLFYCKDTYKYDDGVFAGVLQLTMYEQHGISCVCYYTGLVENL